MIFETLAQTMKPEVHFPDQINLQLRARNFDGAFYEDRVNGVFCKALREFLRFQDLYINENECETIIGDAIYFHETFDESSFNECKIVAERHRFDDSIIKTLILTKQI